MFLIVIYFLSLNTVNTYRQDERLLVRAQDAANTLMLTQGYPPDWDQYASNASAVQALGIVSRRNVIDGAKLAALNSTNIGYMIGLERYNISITITQGLLTVYQTGSVSNDTSLILVERTCLYNGSPSLFKLSVSG